MSEELALFGVSLTGGGPCYGDAVNAAKPKPEEYTTLAAAQAEVRRLRHELRAAQERISRDEEAGVRLLAMLLCHFALDGVLLLGAVAWWVWR